MNKLVTRNTGKEGKYCIYEIEYKGKKYQLANQNMYGDIGYSVWNILPIDDEGNPDFFNSLETVYTVAEAKSWIKENC